MLPLLFGFWPKHVACFMEFIFFHISLLKSLNLVLISGAKLDAWMLTHLDRVSIKILWKKKKNLVEVLIFITEAYSEPYQTSKMEWTSKIVNGYGQFTIFAKSFILEVWQVSEYAFVVQYWTIIASINYLIICFIVNYVVTHNPLIY